LQITTDDLLQAAQMEERGMLDRKERSKEKWEQIALNEAAMAVAALNLPNMDDVEYVSTLLSYHLFFFFGWTLSHSLISCLKREIL
jgi:hypothetical protein